MSSQNIYGLNLLFRALQLLTAPSTPSDTLIICNKPKYPAMCRFGDRCWHGPEGRHCNFIHVKEACHSAKAPTDYVYNTERQSTHHLHSQIDKAMRIIRSQPKDPAIYTSSPRRLPKTNQTEHKKSAPSPPQTTHIPPTIHLSAALSAEDTDTHRMPQSAEIPHLLPVELAVESFDFEPDDDDDEDDDDDMEQYDFELDPMYDDNSQFPDLYEADGRPKRHWQIAMNLMREHKVKTHPADISNPRIIDPEQRAEALMNHVMSSWGDID